MPYRATDPETGQSLRLIGDSPPTEQELEEVFASRSQSTQSGRGVNRPSASERTESLIAERPSSIAHLRERVTSPLGIIDFLGLRPGGRRQLAQEALQASGEQVESVLANTGLALQRGRPQDIPRDVAKGFLGERPAQTGDIMRSVGVPEPIAAATGFLAMMGLPGVKEPVVGSAKMVGGAAKSAITSPIKRLLGRFNRPGKTPAEMAEMTVEQAAKLPASKRSTYLAVQSAKEQQAIDRQIEAFTYKAQETAKRIHLEQQEIGQQAPRVAFGELQSLNDSFRPLARKMSDRFDSQIDTAIANAESAQGQPIIFTRERINQKLAERFLQSKDAGDPAITLDPDPQHYRQLTEKLSQKNLVNEEEITARQIHNLAKEFGQEIGVAAKQKRRAYTPDEVASQHLRDILLGLLEEQGIDVTEANQGWAKWVPSRNLALRLQTEQGPSTLIRIVRGKNPKGEQALRNLQALSQEPLGQETEKLFQQLDSLEQQKVIEASKKLEFDRVIKQQRRFAKGSAIERKDRLEELAQHRDRIRRLIWLAAGGAATAAGWRGIMGIGRAAGEMASNQ